jgi:hypothetical protein
LPCHSDENATACSICNQKVFHLVFQCAAFKKYFAPTLKLKALPPLQEEQELNATLKILLEPPKVCKSAAVKQHRWTFFDVAKRSVGEILKV